MRPHSAGDQMARARALDGVDVVLDTVAGNTLALSPEVLADRGRVVSIVDTLEPQNLLVEGIPFSDVPGYSQALRRAQEARDRRD
ncbi:zinc-binding dehydrogenase [Streptomyces sp. CB02115]|uniref:zinc-binding dehydrogenase n=1 Tax=Streptomyces sp. CB02115 TaxID=1703939 RepID=UPI0026D3E8BD